MDEQRWQSQKYSTRLHLGERSGGPLSRRKSLPSVRWRNGVKHKGLLHLAAITGNPLKTKYGAV